MNRLLTNLVLLAGLSCVAEAQLKNGIINNGNIKSTFVPATGGGGQTVTDTFDRADSADLGAAWTPVDDSFKIVSNAAVANNGASADAAEVYTGVTWTANQSAEVTISGAAWSVGAGSGYGVGVRWSSSAITGYRLVINSIGGWEVLRFNAGASTAVGSGTTTYAAGSVLLLSAIGTTIAASYNGASLGSWTDANIASGSPAICESSSVTGGTCDTWTGKDGL